MSLNNLQVGQINPTQLMYTYGVGAIVDLPHFSAIVMGLDDWPRDPNIMPKINEPRLLRILRAQPYGSSVQALRALPFSRETEMSRPLDASSRVGVPIAAFPRWMVCPACRALGKVGQLFEPADQIYPPDQIHFKHVSCERQRPPMAVPARILAACENGHLDDFPWVEYAHRNVPCNAPRLRLFEFGTTGEARDLLVKCDECGKSQNLTHAFDREQRDSLPMCRGRRPHLRDYDPTPCEHHLRPLVLGASNLWYAVTLGILAIPSTVDRLELFLDENWSTLNNATSREILDFIYEQGLIRGLIEFPRDRVWSAIEKRRAQDANAEAPTSDTTDLKLPEWQAFSNPDAQAQTEDFRLRAVPAPERFKSLLAQVVLVEKLREVRSLVGFTRIDVLDELSEGEADSEQTVAPLVRGELQWVPTVEVRGEGIFIQFSENQVQTWLRKSALHQTDQVFRQAHYQWRDARGITPPEAHYPTLRYVFLHTFAHALMRQLALECGYSQASVRERIYSRTAEEPGGPMAGVLIYTAAPDSEGTLGGLVSQGNPETLERLITQSLEDAQLCSSDPTCAEKLPNVGGNNIDGAACHTCLFAPETSCERGNRYLDRALLVRTLKQTEQAFFTIG